MYLSVLAVIKYSRWSIFRFISSHFLFMLCMLSATCFYTAGLIQKWRQNDSHNRWAVYLWIFKDASLLHFKINVNFRVMFASSSNYIHHFSFLIWLSHRNMNNKKHQAETCRLHLKLCFHNEHLVKHCITYFFMCFTTFMPCDVYILNM